MKKYKKSFQIKNVLDEYIKKWKEYIYNICHEKYIIENFLKNIMAPHKEIILNIFNKNLKELVFHK